MKKLFFLIALFSIMIIQNAFAQDNSKTPPSQLLSLYYEIKDALVSGNANTASAKAEEFVKAIGSVDAKVIADANRDVLLKDASHISESKDLKRQREYFAPLSDNMFALAKAVKLSADPIYQQYCPMKKASWLSSQQAIKNPYYGTAMLTCGKVAATL